MMIIQRPTTRTTGMVYESFKTPYPLGNGNRTTVERRETLAMNELNGLRCSLKEERRTFDNVVPIRERCEIGGSQLPH